jgi:hypothetical protein
MKFVRSEVLTAVNMSTLLFWAVMPRILVCRYTALPGYNAVGYTADSDIPRVFLPPHFI